MGDEEREAMGEGGRSGGLERRKAGHMGRPTRIKRRVLIVKKRFSSPRQTQLKP